MFLCFRIFAVVGLAILAAKVRQPEALAAKVADLVTIALSTRYQQGYKQRRTATN